MKRILFVILLLSLALAGCMPLAAVPVSSTTSNGGGNEPTIEVIPADPTEEVLPVEPDGGIGGPSTSIAVEELAQLGIRTFLRVGTTGAIQPHINVGDVLVTTASVRLDGASLHFAPMEYPAVADFTCTTALVEAAKAVGATTHIGVTASSDTFYPGQERYDTFSGRVVSRFKGSMEEWQQMGVMNYEMESATLLTMCSSQGLRAGMVAGVIVNRTQQEIPNAETMKQTESHAVKIVVEAARRLI